MNYIKHYFFLLTISLTFSCDDGDIIINDFEFENNRLSFCNTDSQSVLFNINATNEVISFNLNRPFNPTDINNNNGTPIAISNTNQVIYRKFNSNINSSSYFCSPVPDNSIPIINELKGNDAGQVIISTLIIANDDIDNDNITNEIEGFIEGIPDSDLLDTDGDGIPNYRDQDDDNDNILTTNEISFDRVNNIFTIIDTDSDGIDNYLDNDDDGDGLLTRDEANPKNSNPANTNGIVDGVPKYLDSDITDEIIADKLINNTIVSQFRTTVVAKNLILTDNSNNPSIERENFVFGVFENTSDGGITTEVPFSIAVPTNP